MSPLATLVILAQTSVPTTAGAQPMPGPLQMIRDYGLIVAMIIFVYFFMFRSKRQQDKKVRTLLDSMKKGDRVQTIGGIIGTLVEVRETEVVLKVDETSNTKMRFVRKAIAHVFSDEVKDDKAKG